MPRRPRCQPAQVDVAAVLASIIANPLKVAPLTKILDRNGALVEFAPTPAQATTIACLLQNKWAMILKARQLGSTTAIVFALVVMAMLRPGYRVLIVAQTWKTALKLSQMAERFVANFPSALCPAYTSTTTNIVFSHGSTIEVQTASTASSRGSTYNAVLASEVAFWQRPEESARALFQALSGSDTMMILESTPDGMNGYHKLWTQSDHGLHKIFLSWLDEPTYVRHEPYPVPPALQEYADKWNLPPERLYWAAHHLATKCLGSMATFLQECAIDPVSCFLRSGDSFFEQRSEWEHAEFYAGLKTHAPPTKGHTYAIGVDSASGSNHPDADYSAAVVLDVTVPTNITIAAVLLAKEDTEVWGQTVKQLALRYKLITPGNPKGNTVVTNIERTGGWGLPAIKACQAAKLTVFRQRKPDTKQGWVYSSNYGWDTNTETRAEMLSHLQSVVNSGKVALTDSRLQYQAARYVYKDGRPDHPEGEHDDALIALALALMVVVPAREVESKKEIAYPQSHQDIVNLQAKYKMTLQQMRDKGMFGRDAEPQYIGWGGDDNGW